MFLLMISFTVNSSQVLRERESYVTIDMSKFNCKIYKEISTLRIVPKKFAWLWEVESQYVGLFEWSFGHRLYEFNMAFLFMCECVQISFLNYLLWGIYIDAMPIKDPTRIVN